MPTLIIDIETPTGSITEEIELDEAEWDAIPEKDRDEYLASEASSVFWNACNYGFHLKEV